MENVLAFNGVQELDERQLMDVDGGLLVQGAIVTAFGIGLAFGGLFALNILGPSICNLIEYAVNVANNSTQA